jgi:hypothetical protein
VHTVKARGGVDVLLHAFLNLGIRLIWSATCLRDSPPLHWHPLNNRLGGSAPGKKNLLPLSGIEPWFFGRPVRSPVTTFI